MPVSFPPSDPTRRRDNAHFFHPWEGLEALGHNERTSVESAQGIYLSCADGSKLIDGPGGMWCVQVGYGRSEMGAAMAQQAQNLAYFSPFSNTNSLSARLAERLAHYAPGDLNRVFFTTCGSTAVDTALRFVQFRNNLLGKPDKKIILSRQKAYHGSTYLAASVSGKERDRLWLDKADDLCHFLPDVNPARRPEGMSLDAFCDAKLADMENAILELGPDHVAAFIAEPILASGGVIVPPKGYHKGCLEICHKYDVLYISDEVVTGFGRLGHVFASDPVFDITPDIITCAKGLTSGYVPMGAAIISDRLFADISGDNAQGATFSNGYTYSGHPVSTAAALKNLDILEDEGILDHVQEITPLFQDRLHALSDHPLVTDTRGMGLVGCVECSWEGTMFGALNSDLDIGARIDAECQKRGLLIRPIINMCVFSPPLIITKAQINTMFDILDEVLENLAKG